MASERSHRDLGRVGPPVAVKHFSCIPGSLEMECQAEELRLPQSGCVSRSGHCSCTVSYFPASVPVAECSLREVAGMDSARPSTIGFTKNPKFTLLSCYNYFSPTPSSKNPRTVNKAPPHILAILTSVPWVM